MFALIGAPSLASPSLLLLIEIHLWLRERQREMSEAVRASANNHTMLDGLSHNQMDL